MSMMMERGMEKGEWNDFMCEECKKECRWGTE